MQLEPFDFWPENKAHALPGQISSIIIPAGIWNSNEYTCTAGLINPLLAKLQIFQQKHKHLSLISTFPPYWLYNTGSWNSFTPKIRSYKSYLVNIMGADNLEALGARASAATVLP